MQHLSPPLRLRQQGSSPAHLVTRLEGAAEVLVADAGVEGLPILLEGLEPGVEALLIPPTQPARPVLAALLQAPCLRRLHLLGHGAAGEIRLGRSALGRRWLQTLRPLCWAGPLQEICLWSCGTAAGDHGRACLQLLADRCGVVVHASDNAVGATALGGSWQLGICAEPNRSQCGAGADGPWQWSGPPPEPRPLSIGRASPTPTLRC